MLTFTLSHSQGAFFACNRDIFGQQSCYGKGRFQYFIAEAMAVTEAILFTPTAADHITELSNCLVTSNRSSAHVSAIACEGRKGKPPLGIIRPCREWKCYGDTKWCVRQ